MPDVIQVQIGQPEWTTVAIDQRYKTIANPNRKHDTLIREIFIPAGSQFQMGWHFGEKTEIKASTFSQVEKDRWLSERDSVVMKYRLIETRTMSEPTFETIR